MVGYREQYKECLAFGIVTIKYGTDENQIDLYCNRYKTKCKSSVCREERRNNKTPEQLTLFEEEQCH